MKKIQFFDRRAVSMTLALAMLLGIVAPVLAPISVSAGIVTDRQITLSDSAAGATGVDYELVFTAPSTAGAVVVDFCNDSPIIGQTCTAPTGLDITSATSDPAGVTDSANSLFLTTSISAGVNTITFSGITNPTSATTSSTGFYARVLTYTDGTVAAAQHTAPATPGTYIDGGGIAMAITNPIEVSAAVRETMTFCVSAAAPTQNCAGTSAPSLKLGHGSPEALDATATDVVDAYTQISTNAATGAIVKMKIGNECGGLSRGDPALCDIAPQTTKGVITAGASAKFGLNVGAAVGASGAGTPSGAITRADPYDGTTGDATTTQFGLDWVSGNATGVGSDYGSTIYDTNDEPINNQNVPLKFGATVTSTTAAGLYRAQLSLIATGKY